MKEYNKAFFGLYQNIFLVLKEQFGEERALDIIRIIFERGLKTAYDSMGFQKGNVQNFAKVLKERDESVGLRIEFPEVTENKIIYQFHTDPFPGLKGHVSHEKFDDTYIAFKVRHLLGENWSYRSTQHIWDGAEYTEFVIERK